MYNPVATYRIQFHKEFSFDDFDKSIAYLRELGITTIYASPIFKAVPSSVHGYDGIHPLQINPEIGTEEQLRRISNDLKKEGIGWLQDIVPNHMAFDPRNEWLMDVLEKGQLSLYASFFDINWNSKLHQGRLMVPFLGSTLEEVVNNGELQLVSTESGLCLQYYDSAYPVHARTYSTIVQTIKGNTSLDKWHQELTALLNVNEATTFTEQWDKAKAEWIKFQSETSIKTGVDQAIKTFNSDKQKLLGLVNEQTYALCHWQETDYQINYRRFFTVNGLICLNIQDEQVFEQYHQFVNTLVKDGIFQGLRIDHIDGLYNPTQYLERLQHLAGEDTYIVVEKILEPKEALPSNWSIQGNTGYDFLSIVNNLFTNKKAETAFTSFYQKTTRNWQSIHQQLHNKKSYILYNHMAGELDNLYHLFLQLKLVEHRYLSNVHPDDMKTAIAEFLIQCPVYRYYSDSLPLPSEEAAAVQDILNRMRRSASADKTAIEILERIWLHKPHEGNEDYNQRTLKFYQRCMQFTGPLMAKGVEDTLMYTYHRFIGHNEVGDSPEAFGHTPETFHQMMEERQAKWPLSINATSTHDTKRGEDARARLNVLTDLSDEWISLVKQWQEMNRELGGDNAPDANDEYFIYQSLIGCYPMPQQDEDNFSNRFQQYLEKALREAKLHSNWTTPNQAYETATKEFAVRLVDQAQPFWKSFKPFFTKVADFGIINSLVQVLLKFTCPGVPDVYQGCELWDLSFVDPDNRRPVDYTKRHQWLQAFSENKVADEAFWQELWADRYTGRIKLWLVQQLLQLRKQNTDVFTQGEYIPLEVHGTYKDSILAFARKQEQNALIIVVPLHTASICAEQKVEVAAIDWKDTRISLPFAFEGEGQSLLADMRLTDIKELRVKDLFKPLPFAIIKLREEVSVRGAGILMHITSLPSPYGIGDLGPEAKAFANFLHRSQQKFWQLLPLNPTEGGQGHSPYSAISSKAGNPLLISPEWLIKAGLLEAQDLKQYQQPVQPIADYAKAEEVKKTIFEQAYTNFKNGADSSPLHEAFTSFCEKESEWLNDFALYVVLKAEHGGKPWYEWPDEYKLYQKEALEKLRKEKEQEVTKAKWLQFIFSQQWHELKDYCNSRNIQLIGDLPFYVSYDSVDVWANREFFALDEAGNRTGMAGVPPDAFSDDGQLWGMPVFKWEVLKEAGYTWWIERLRKNIELFDLIRLDHFRAFAAYWDVPAGEATAKNGEWKQGPGHDFFEAIENALGKLPFVAEDLGDIDDAVYELRDRFRMPGMKVLQFAFGDDMPRSTHIPHVYSSAFIAYTGTHDNNTVVGWYDQEADAGSKRRLEQYLGKQVNRNNVHWELGRLAYASVANIVILPLQDVLGLDGSARMNKPSSGENNWAWRLVPGQLHSKAENQLKEWVYLYNR
jgi:malto-oligosyltrehalose synthase/4-alpha-glucanotransferase